MLNKTSLTVYALLALLLPLLIISSNAGFYLGFADAAEFALTTFLTGIAHAPGFPSYILTGKLWSIVLSWAGAGHITAMVYFSIVCTAVATLLLFLTINKLLLHIYNDLPASLRHVTAFTASTSFFTGVTAWHWSSNVEVYSFQVLAVAMLIYGFIHFAITPQRRYIYIAAAGAALGLTNHHLTMIFLLPFMMVFFMQPFAMPVFTKQKTVKPKVKIGFPRNSFLLFTLVTAGITMLFYGWMYFRASQAMPFQFGSPDSMQRLIYHLAGGAWIKNTQQTVSGLAALRFPYFMQITFSQLFLFLPFIILGITELFRLRIPKLIYITVGYYLIMLLYQLRIDQTSDTDAYMLPAFFLLALCIPFGLVRVAKWFKNIQYIFPLLLGIQIFLHYKETDKRTFDVSATLMQELDRSVPQGSVVLIADWTTVIQYYYFRIAENFRPDLIVLNYDLKFTHYRILPELYPEFYKQVKPEYDHFIELLGQAHPQEIYNTGCTLDEPLLLDSWVKTVERIKQYCNLKSVAFMADPKAFIFLTQYNLMSNNSHISGPFVSTLNTGLGAPFLKMNYQWLDSPLLLKEPAASDKMVDLEAALDFNRNYYKSTGNQQLAMEAESSYNKIKQLQRKMKRNMPFVYRPK